MESAPTGVDLDEIRAHMSDVAELWRFTISTWTITSGMPTLSAHVTVEPDPFQNGSGAKVLTNSTPANDCLEIGHTTFQLESV